MKQFRKNEQGAFVCEECKKICISRIGLGHHINKNHDIKQYHDKWIKEEGEGFCKICKKETEFISLLGYKNCCSDKCYKQYNKIRTEEQCLKKFGVKNNFQRKECKEKSKQTCLKNWGVKNCSVSKKIKKKKENTYFKKFGVKNPMQSVIIKEKSKKTCKQRYGVDYSLQNKEIREKGKQTCFKLFGVENASQSKEIKKIKENTCLNNFGVIYPMQNLNIFEKGQKSALILKKFRDTNLWYQGSYELDFLEKYYDKYPDIQRAKSIRYIFENKQHYYHPDFYIPSLNLIIEIKNSWIAKRDKLIIKIKEKATIANGFKYIMIIDKNYSDINF